MAVYEYVWSYDEPPAIVGELITGLGSGNVNIQLWEDGDLVSIASSGCLEIDATGRYTWSTIHVGTMHSSRVQYHWRMTDGGANTDEGDCELYTREQTDGGMPSLGDQSSYIQRI